ncbi:MAG: hypothetical protein HOF23_01740 [Rhodospirillaceae bacterium]|nr:hypothetical protein [Rhodospirillaceae bacterium]
MRGKAEAVTFSIYLTIALHQQSDFNDEAERLLQIFTDSYHRDRDIYSP